MRSYLDGMLRYFEFSGRSTRMQYWMFYLVELLLFAAAIAVDLTLLDGLANPRKPLLPMTLFVSFVHIVPSFALQVRRLHDIGRSGAWMVLTLIPFGGLVLLYWSCCASESGRNAYNDPEPSSYEPYYTREQARMPRYTTIPRQVRMGSRPPSVGYDGLSSPERFI